MIHSSKCSLSAAPVSAVVVSAGPRLSPLTAGFSLLEILLAAALSMVVVLAALQATSTTRDVTDASIRASVSQSQLQAVLSFLGDDVRRSTSIGDLARSPVWAAEATSTSGLSLSMPESNTCAVAHQVAYAVVPRTRLQGTVVSEWIRVGPQKTGDGTLALLRIEKCGTTITRRLMIDRLVVADFALAYEGTSGRDADFSADRVSSGGVPIRAVRLQLAAQSAHGRGSVRTPQSGTLSAVATSRLATAF